MKLATFDESEAEESGASESDTPEFNGSEGSYEDDSDEEIEEEGEDDEGDDENGNDEEQPAEVEGDGEETVKAAEQEVQVEEDVTVEEDTEVQQEVAVEEGPEVEQEVAIEEPEVEQALEVRVNMLTNNTDITFYAASSHSSCPRPHRGGCLCLSGASLNIQVCHCTHRNKEEEVKRGYYWKGESGKETGRCKGKVCKDRCSGQKERRCHDCRSRAFYRETQGDILFCNFTCSDSSLSA